MPSAESEPLWWKMVVSALWLSWEALIILQVWKDSGERRPKDLEDDRSGEE